MVPSPIILVSLGKATFPLELDVAVAHRLLELQQAHLCTNGEQSQVKSSSSSRSMVPSVFLYLSKLPLCEHGFKLS